MNAYELADELSKYKQTLTYATYIADAQKMLRQQADRIAELEKELLKNFEKGAAFGFDEGIIHQKQQTKPLSDEEIFKIYKDIYDIGLVSVIFTFDPQALRFARAIEERHGIK